MKEESANDCVRHEFVFAELPEYMEDCRITGQIQVFKLADLTKLYAQRLRQLGIKEDCQVPNTRLKNRLLAYFPDRQAHLEGRDVLSSSVTT